MVTSSTDGDSALSGSKDSGRTGLWETVLSRGVPLDGKVRYIVQTFLPDAVLPAGEEASLQQKAATSAADSDDVPGDALKLPAVGASEQAHGERSPQSTQSTRRSQSSDTAPTGHDAVVASMQKLQLASASTSVPVDDGQLGAQEEVSLAARLRTCTECNEHIEGSVFMLQDLPYCCQRHRLTAYHKMERRRKEQGPRYDTPRLEVSGLRQTFGSWA